MKRNMIYLLGLILLAACSSNPVEQGAMKEDRLTDQQSNSSLKEVSVSSQEAPLYTALESAYRTENTEQLKAQSEKILMQNPNDLKALSALGIAYYKKGQHAAAAELFNKVNNLTGGRSSAYNNLALLALAKNRTEEALQLFRKARELQPDQLAPAANAAAVYAAVEDHNKVIYSLENSVKKEKADRVSLNHYAIALIATGQESDAVKLYEDILDSEPDHQLTLLNYSVLLIDRQKQYQKGLDLLGRLKFVGSENDHAILIKDLENRAKAGLK